MTNLGAVYLKIGNRDDAAKFFDEAIAASPDYANAWNMRGVMYHEAGDFNLATENFQRAFELNSNDEYILKNLAELYVQTDNRNSVDWQKFGTAYFYLNNCDKAVEFYTKAVEIKPDDVTAWHDLGMIAFSSEDYDRAIAHFEKALVLDPTRKKAASCYILGIIYFQRDEIEKARTYLTKATDLAPKEAFVWRGLGDVYYKLEDWDKAVEYFSKAFELDPKDEVTCRKLADCYDAFGKIYEAAYEEAQAKAVTPEDKLEAVKIQSAASECRLKASRLRLEAQATGTANRLSNLSKKYSPTRNAMQAFLNGNEIRF
ncbi:MAG: tetratricopeptide repeat protein [Selenomonadaceae bacterium]|nr:tetratricopeptide repeat protein [Selenomonadaceae bacterium]